MPAPDTGENYLVELCSGECRCWRCLGPDARGQVWWRDVETGREFNEGSLMYVWRIVRKADDSPTPPA